MKTHPLTLLVRTAFAAALLASLPACAGQALAAPTLEAERVGLDLRRTTLVVKDLPASLAFYRDALGLRVAYDQVIRTPRSAKTDAEAERLLHLVLLRANDDYIGMLGLMQYTKPERTPRPAKTTTTLDPGDVVLVFNTTDLKTKFEKAKAMGARVDTEPVMTSYPSYDGKGVIKVLFSAFFDPDGHYVELNEVIEGLPVQPAK